MRVCLHRSGFQASSARLPRVLLLPVIMLAALFFGVVSSTKGAGRPLVKPMGWPAAERSEAPEVRYWGTTSLCLSHPPQVAVFQQIAKASKTSAPPALGVVGPFDDIPAPLEPKRPTDEAGRDRLHALALFATGRALEQKGDLAGALQRYERAQRYDADSRTIVQAVVELATRLERTGESDRYLQRLVKLGGGNAVDVEELAFRTAMGGDLKRAITLYQHLLKTRKDAPKEPIDVVMRWRLSEIYYLAGQYKEAAECAAWVIDALKNPDKFGLDKKLVARLLAGPHLPYDLFGEYFLLADRPQQAKAMFEKANAAAANDTLLQYRLARVDARAGKNEQALARLESCLAKPAKIREEALQDAGLAPYEFLGQLLEDLGKKDEFIPRLEKLYNTSPKNMAAGYTLAEKYRESSQMQKAEKLYKSLLAKQPAAVGYAGLMEIYRAGDRMEPLLELLAKAAEQTASLEPVGVLVRAVSDEGEELGKKSLLEKLAKAARQKEKKGPKSAAAGACLAVALLALDSGRFDLADEFFQKAIEGNPQEAGELLMIWSVGLLADDRNARAAEVLRQGFAKKMLAADDPIPYYYLATALAMIDQTEEAIAAAEKAVALKSDSPRFMAQHGWVLYRGKQYDRAARIHEQILKRFDSNRKNSGLRETLRGVRLALAGIEVNRGNSSRAEELLQEVLDEFPDDISAMNDLGFLWANENRHLQRALRMTREAVAAEPENAAYLDSLGWTLYRLGNHEAAAVELEKAVAIDPQEPEILEHLAEVYDSLKKHQKAKDCHRRALEHGAVDQTRD